MHWIGGQQFLGIDSTNHSVVLSPPDEGVGLKPSDLLMVALGSCTAVDIVEIMDKKRIELSILEIKTEAVQADNPPWSFRKIHLHYRLPGKGCNLEAARLAIELSEE